MKKPFPRKLILLGYFFATTSWLLAVEKVWEQTVLTWNNGPQMVWFSLMHTGIGIPFILAHLAGLIWFIAVLIVAFRSRSFGGKLIVSLAGAYVIAFIVLEIPYGFWQRLFVNKLAQSPRAIEFVIEAAAFGDIGTLKAFESRGVSINARDRYGATPLHAAAIAGQTKVAQYLISKGAEINTVNRYGDSPLENAISSNKVEVVKLLSDLGAKRIRGSDEQHEKASADIVREQMEETNLKTR